MKFLVIVIGFFGASVAKAGQIGVLDEIDWSALKIVLTDNVVTIEDSSMSIIDENAVIASSLPNEPKNIDVPTGIRNTYEKSNEIAPVSISLDSKMLDMLNNAAATASKVDLIRVKKLMADIVATNLLTKTEKLFLENAYLTLENASKR
jgi:hypothetical protein